MIHRICIEKWDANLEEVTIRAWFKAEGESVAVGEPLVEIITDKMTFEMESPEAGVLRRILAPARSVVPVGYVIAVLAEEKEPLPDVEEENRVLLRQHAARQAILQAMAEETVTRAVSGPIPSESGRVRATPAARRLAREQGVELAQVVPADGVRISEEDVRAFLARRREEEP